MNDTPGLVTRYYLKQLNKSEHVEFMLARLLTHRYWGYRTEPIKLEKNNDAELGLKKVVELLTDENNMIEKINIGKGYYYSDIIKNTVDEDKDDNKDKDYQLLLFENIKSKVKKIVLNYDCCFTLRLVCLQHDVNVNVYLYKLDGRYNLLEKLNFFLNMNSNRCPEFIYIGIPSILLANLTTLVYDFTTDDDDVVKDFNSVLNKIYNVTVVDSYFSFDKKEYDKIFQIQLPNSRAKKVSIENIDKFKECIKDNILFKFKNKTKLLRSFIYFLENSSCLEDYYLYIKKRLSSSPTTWSLPIPFFSPVQFNFNNELNDVCNKIINLFYDDIVKFQNIIENKHMPLFQGMKHDGSISKEYLKRNKEWYELWKKTKSMYSTAVGTMLIPNTEQSFCVPCEKEYNLWKGVNKDELYKKLSNWDKIEKLKVETKGDTSLLVEALARIVILMNEKNEVECIEYPKCRIYDGEEIRIFMNQNEIVEILDSTKQPEPTDPAKEEAKNVV